MMQKLLCGFFIFVLLGALLPLPAAAASANFCTSGKQITIADVQNMINMFLGTTPNSGCEGGGSNVPTGYSQSDLIGTWQLFQFIVGSNSGWARAKLSIDSQGNVTTSNSVNSAGGSGSMGSLKLAVDGNGVIATNDPTATTRLNLSSSKSIAVGTGGSGGDESFYIMVKSGSGFLQSHLQGYWKWNSLMHQGTSGNPNNMRWERGDLSIDSAGATSFTNRIRSSGAGTDTTTSSSGNALISSQGVVTGPSNPSFYGVLSVDKNLLVSVNTNSDGSISLGLFTKTGGSTFSLADMQGSWRTNYLMVKDVDWGRALTTIDAFGHAQFTQIMQNTGTRADMSTSFNAMSSGGIFTEADNATFSGVMTLGKTLMIGTLTQDRTGSPTPSMFIWVK